MSERFHPQKRALVSLTEDDRRDAELVLLDRFQSPRARKRAQALILLGAGGTLEEAGRVSGLSLDMVEGLVDRLKTGQVRGALFGTPRAAVTCRYDQGAIADALRKLVVSRPVGGLYWTLGSLASEVGKMVPGVGDISHEHLRQIMVRKLGIRSVRHIEPFWKQQLIRKAEASVACADQ